MCPGIKRIEIGPLYGPAAVGYPVPLFKVDRFERGAKAGPMPGGPAKIMQPGRLKRIIALAGGFSPVQILHSRLIVETTTFQKDNFIGRIQPFQGNADARGPGADDTNIAFNQALVWDCPGVGMHLLLGLKYGK